MPKAVDSNSTLVPGIQPAHIVSNLHRLSNGLRVCKEMLDDLMEQLDRQMHEISQFIDVRPLNIKALRHEFIAEKLKQGLSEKQISQALNVRVSVIRRSIAALQDEADRAGYS